MLTRKLLNQEKTGGELMCSGRVSSSCCTSGTCRVNLVTNPVIVMNEERTGKSIGEVMTSSYPLGTFDPVAYLVNGHLCGGVGF
jgi:hypothetical protein